MREPGKNCWLENICICIYLYLLIVLSSPDPPEYLEVEYNEGDDRDDTGAHQSSPVDVEPEQKFQQFFREMFESFM